MPTSRRRRSPQAKKCQGMLQRKIAINMKEPQFVSRAQAIAVAYAQVKKFNPKCAKYFTQKGKKSVKKSVKKSARKSRKTAKKSVRKSRK
jgi:hypothetical protein